MRGAHKLKGGFDFQFDDILNFFPGFFGGSYTFRSLASFNGGRPNGTNEQYQQNFAGPGTPGAETNPDIQEYSFFVQDEWRLRPDISVNAGLRYDLMKTKQPPVGSLGQRTLTVAGTGQTLTHHTFGSDRPFRNFQRVIAFESTAESRYNGVTFELNRRFSSGLRDWHVVAQLDTERHPDRAVGPTLHGPRGQRRSEQRRQHAERHRAGYEPQRVQVAGRRHLSIRACHATSRSARASV